MDPPHPRSRLLRRVAARSPMDGQRPSPARRRADHSGRQRCHRRPRRTGAGIPPAPGRPAGGLRPAPLPRAAARGDRRDARDPRGHGPIPTALRDARTPGRPGGGRGDRSRYPRRTTRMTDDRSLERAARSWIEIGPTQAPDRAVEAALLHIQTTPQERDLRIPWRLPRMITPARIATAAVIAVLAVGGAFFYTRPQETVGGPTPSAGQAAGQTQLDGVWQSCPTEQEILAAGGDPAEAKQNAGCTTLTLRDGVFSETGASASTTIPRGYGADATSITIHRSNGEEFDFLWSVVGDDLTLTKSPKAGAVSPAPWLATPFHRTAE